eukprot:1655291-Rhodomonas_salina.1
MDSHVSQTTSRSVSSYCPCSVACYLRVEKRNKRQRGDAVLGVTTKPFVRNGGFCGQCSILGTELHAPLQARHTSPNGRGVVAVGPKTQDVESLKALYGAGMRCARMNFSHGSHE